MAFFTFGYFYAQYQVASSIQHQLSEKLNQKVGSEILQGLNSKDEESARLFRQINGDLQTVYFSNNLFLSPVTAFITNQTRDGINPNKIIYVDLPKIKTQLKFYLEYQIIGLNLLIASSVIAGLAVIAIFMLPVPVNQQTKTLRDKFLAFKLTQQQAINCAKQYQTLNAMQQQVFDFLAENQINILSIADLLSWCADKKEIKTWHAHHFAWFCCALKKNPDDLNRAFAIACSENSIEFDAQSQALKIHGLTIQLAKTPFLYYLWYAKHKLDSDGWILNPATNQPSQPLANSLIDLMETYNGHAKAVNDLKSFGLKAKTIDQNRNKIKQELTAYLGDELAESYLFESRRDSKTQRYWYRLNCPENMIKIQELTI
ncbi:hypothetical protein N7931_05700 [Catenovulum sp. 2E275]|uniref:hypothetical protein n=1 Tax=Catenovulum sp. 2E275 TaxID=2980497 RepID=UPI0021D2C1D1|nr:hypothetical protein [Catenovulum sp. 2E275]MCU4675123.1 hypothetical protein [Catenovulum sp. 2E275]